MGARGLERVVTHEGACVRIKYVKEICPRGNNKVVILYFLIHDKCLLFMLELY